MVRSNCIFRLQALCFILSGAFVIIGSHSSAQAGDLSASNTNATSAAEQLELPTSSYSDIWTAINKRSGMVSSLNAYYSYSNQVNGIDIDGGGLNAILAPTFTINQKAVFIGLYNGNYNKKLDFYSDEVGPRARTQSTTHTLTPMVRIDLDDQAKYSITPSVFHTQSFNIDVEGGSWGEGLYNYRDTGAGLNFRVKNLVSENVRGMLNFGIQYYQRKYPNYESLLDLAIQNGIEEDERDYQGILLRAGYNRDKSAGLSWGAGSYFLAKNLNSKKIIQSNGVLDAQEEQEDNLLGVDLRLSYIPANMNRLRLGLDLSGSFNRSNQNYYDGGEFSGDLADDVFQDGFYDYNAYKVASHITFSWARLPMTAHVSYAYKDTEYTGRLAQYLSGEYKNEKQAEKQNELDAEVRYNFLKQWNAYLRYQHLRVNSNNEDESVYLYNHQVNTYSAGISISY